MAKLTPEVYRRVSEIVASAVEHPTPLREKYIREACAGDRELQREVETLLEYGPDADNLLAAPIPGKRANLRLDKDMVAAPLGPLVGDRVGSYKLLKRIDEGGMGTVFLAAREDDFEKKVALKLVRAGLLQHRMESHPRDNALLQRFLNERQILANLEHPNIARILDGGATEDGIPFFVMELVDGQPIDSWCDSRKLRVRERLELFRKVCSAIQLAHQNLIVHRDLKPGNILVDAQGEPKLLDFGIAKQLATDSSTLTSGDGQTEPGQVPMTLRYASPEQVQGKAITTASDIYSLGVLLFQLLTGHTPYFLKDGQFLTLAQAICDQEPRRPSSKIGQEEELFHPQGSRRITPGTISSQRSSSPKRLKRSLAGDIDSIVLKALAKDPKKRYSSVEQLSLDIERFLDGQPVQAREGALLYRCGKFLLRHRWRVASVAFFLLIAGTAFLNDQRAREAERQKIRIADRLAEIMIDPFEDEMNREKPVNIEEYLDSLRDQMRRALEDEPLLLAKQLGIFGPMYSRLGSHQKARATLEESLQLHRRHYSGDHQDLPRILNNLAASYDRSGDYQQAEKLYRAALEMKRRLGLEGLGLARAMCNLASMLRLRGRYPAAEELYLECLRLRKESPTPDPAAIARTLRGLGVLSYTRGYLDRAEAQILQALASLRATGPPEPLEIAAYFSSLGRVFHAQGKSAEAEELFGQVLTIRLQKLGETHEYVALTRKDLAAVFLDRGDNESAAVLLSQSLAVLRKVKPENAWEIAGAESLWGVYLAANGQIDKAEPFLRHGHDALAASLGPHAIQTVQARHHLWEWIPDRREWGEGIY